MKANKEAEKMLKNYLYNIPKWQQWVDETIEWSKKNKESVLVVDKMAQQCTIYKNGKVKYQFHAEFGKNWMGDKRYKGDYATPEGRYQIIKKLGPKYTKYYKALLINYPNNEDKEEFARDIKNGSLPRWSKIGNLIEIHGNGGKGINWTNGCVALSDHDMDKLFDYVNIGTPVTIVGSLKSFSELKSLSD
jgi:murein L,D-transpeptidase YafK